VDTRHPASIDAPVVPASPLLILSEAEHDGHQSDTLDLASLEHAFALLAAVREDPEPFDPEHVATLDVALASIYREICRRAPRTETVARRLSVRERMLVDLRAVGPVSYPRSDYGPALAAVGPDYDAPAGAGDDVEAFRG
jgi:hypothetical protein